MDYVKNFEDYYQHKETLHDLFCLLCDRNLHIEQNPNRIDELIFNFVLKYYFDYLKISTFSSLDDLTTQILLQLKVRKEYDLEETDNFALQCIGDLRATVAVFREIMFTQLSCINDTDKNIVLDLGCGTGILSIAGAIALKRQGLSNIVIKGYDNKLITVKNAQRVMEPLQDENLTILINHQDILDTNVYKDIYQERKKLRYLITETFIETTAPLLFKDKKIIFQNSDGCKQEEENVKWGDPFGFVMQNIFHYFDNLYDDVQEGATLLFPNIVKGYYQPSKQTLLMKNVYSEPIHLEKVASKYSHYQVPENIGTRW